MFRLQMNTVSTFLWALNSTKEELKQDLMDRTEAVIAEVRAVRESTDWSIDIAEGAAEQRGKHIVAEVLMKMERRLVRQKLDIEEMVERKVAQNNAQLEHTIREELYAMERRLQVCRSSSSQGSGGYFSHQVQGAVAAANRRNWAGRPIGRSLFNQDGSNSMFKSSSSSLGSVFRSSSNSSTSSPVAKSKAVPRFVQDIRYKNSK